MKLGNYNNQFTEIVGYLIYGAFNIASVIVLLNMLIAMMSKSYETIEEHADVEWKFARSKLYMEYIKEGKNELSKDEFRRSICRSRWNFTRSVQHHSVRERHLLPLPSDFPSKKTVRVVRAGGGRRHHHSADESTGIAARPEETFERQHADFDHLQRSNDAEQSSGASQIVRRQSNVDLQESDATRDQTLSAAQTTRKSKTKFAKAISKN